MASVPRPSYTSSQRAAMALGIAAVAILAVANPASAQPDFDTSYFVPQTGPITTPSEGDIAVRFFRTCPNNDGTSLPNNARVKVVIRDPVGTGIPGIPADAICAVLNGGTAAQGFAGSGADSIIANNLWNSAPLCPDVRCISADAPTDMNGITYITFGGADPSNPGVTVRDPNRKWGHYDTKIPIFVYSLELSGRYVTSDQNGTYTLRIKNMDLVGGLGTVMNGGEVVSSLDYDSVSRGLFSDVDPTTYWRDFDNSGVVAIEDLNMLMAHLNHDCDTPNNP